MADFGRGIKAGVVVAAVYLIISVILELTGFSYQFPVITAAGLGIHLQLTDPLLLIGSIYGRIVDGIIFGAVFAALYNSLPSTTSVKKAMVLSSCLWVLVAVELIYTMISKWPTDGGQTAWSAALSVAGVKVTLPSIGSVLAGIISALIFGALTGFLWDRFRVTRLVEAEKGSGVLLVSFALGVWMWLSPIVGVTMYVINQGTIVMEPGPLWWVNILSVVAALLGLPGWVLTLVAWRKTKRDESGLKWGVAGGVIMALTGLMLLPGALAIAGGVLSRRKLASESSTAAIGQ